MAPGGEAGRGPGVGLAGVRVSSDLYWPVLGDRRGHDEMLLIRRPYSPKVAKCVGIDTVSTSQKLTVWLSS